jgi:soluble lytic murein transglycosylase-like protein
MHWVKCLIFSLGMLLATQVALAAEIHHFTDSHGILHITNNGVRKPPIPVPPARAEASRSLLNSPAVAPTPEPLPMATKPPVEPRQAPGADDQPSGARISLSGETSRMIQRALVTGGKEEPGKAAGTLNRAAWTPPQRMQAAAPGTIVCYKDSHQVIHITNVLPEEARPEAPGQAAPAGQEKAEPAMPVSPAFQRISWPSPEQAGRTDWPAPSDPPPGLTEDTVRRYRDGRSVLHITNKPPPRARPFPTLTAVASGAFPAQAQAPPVTKGPQIAADQALLQPVAHPAWKNASGAKLGPEVAAYIQDKLQMASRDATGQSIHRFRDSQGVWHIANEPAPEANASPLAVAAAGEVSPAQALAQPLIRPVDLAVGLGLAREQPKTSGPTVIARRDHRGVLHVFTSTGAERVAERGDPASFLNRVSPCLQAIIVEAAQIHGLPVSLVLAIIRNESNFAPQALSSKGAMGLMQLMPGTAASLGVEDPYAPRENVLAGCRYFRSLLDAFQGSVPLALAAYNAGYQRVISAGWQIPAIKETQNFVTQVMGLYCFLEKRALRL